MSMQPLNVAGHPLRGPTLSSVYLRLVLVLVSWLVFGLATAQAQPANDLFSAREVLQPLDSLGFIRNTDNLNATYEIDEPHTPERSPLPKPFTVRSVWWTLVPPLDGSVEVDTFGSNFDTIVAVYGDGGADIANLQQVVEIAANDDALNTAQSKVTFAAQGGRRYFIQVGGYADAQGTIRLNVRVTPATGGTCLSNSSCAASDFCKQPAPGVPGQCTVRPLACPGVFDPVCSFFNETYSSACIAEQDGANSFPGRCAPLDANSVGAKVLPGAQFADPVNLESGAYTHLVQIIPSQPRVMPFSFSISYTSSEKDIGAVGRKWVHNYAWFVEDLGLGNFKVKRGEDGAADYFEDLGGLFFSRKHRGVYSTLARNGDDTFTYTAGDMLVYQFATDGRLTSITDPNGNRSTITHDGAGRLVSVVDAGGRAAAFTYDANDRITGIDYAGLQQASLSYNAAGDLTSFVLPNGSGGRFTYDAGGNLLQAIGPDDVAFVTNTYDADGRVVEQADGRGNTSSFAYAGDTVTVIDRLGNVTRKTFDAEGRLIGAIGPEGDTWSFGYDRNNNVSRVEDPLGLVGSTSYDDNGNPTLHGNSRGDEIGLGYDGDNNLVSISEPGGGLTQLSYDAAGNPTGIIDPMGHITGYTYDAAGRVIGSTDVAGTETQIDYTASGDIATVSDPTGSIALGHDALGRITSFTDQRGNTSTMEYDPLGALKWSQNALGQRTSYDYDARGNLLQQVESDGSILRYTYNANGDVTSATDPLGNTVRYEFDAEGRMSAKVDATNARTAYRWDAERRLTQTVDALAGLTLAEYDVAGNRLQVVDPRGGVTRYEYDSMGRVNGQTDPRAITKRTNYNRKGLIGSSINGRQQRVSFIYDDAQRLVRVDAPDATVDYTVDAAGNRTRISHAAGAVEQTFDTKNRLTARTDEFGNVVRFAYDPAGNLQTLTYTDGKQVAYEYDALNRLVKVTDWASRVTSYTYDGAGNLAGIDAPDGSTTTFEYDLAKRPTHIAAASVSGETLFDAHYTYDAAGRTTQARVQSPLEPVATALAGVLAYDAADRLESVDGQSVSHDDDGNLVGGVIGGREITLVYDSRSRLLQAGADTYRYDADGLRIGSVIAGTTRRYVWDPSGRSTRLLEEHDGNGNIVARYVHGAGLISREGADPSEFSAYHYDKRGSTVALTDLQGNVTDRYAYAPYGAIVAREGSTANPFTYNGRDGVLDDGNGLYFMRTRYYVPALMRFAQADERIPGSLLRPASMNRYAFVEGNPIDRIDPNGEWGFVSAIGGAIVGATVQVVSNVIQDKPILEDVAGAALSGAIAAGVPGSAILTGGLASGAGSALNGLIRGDGLDPVKIGTSVVIGGATAGIAGRLQGPIRNARGKVADVLQPGTVKSLFGGSPVRTGLANLVRPGFGGALRPIASQTPGDVARAGLIGIATGVAGNVAPGLIDAIPVTGPGMAAAVGLPTRGGFCAFGTCRGTTIGAGGVASGFPQFGK